MNYMSQIFNEYSTPALRKNLKQGGQTNIEKADSVLEIRDIEKENKEKSDFFNLPIVQDAIEVIYPYIKTQTKTDLSAEEVLGFLEKNVQVGGIAPGSSIRAVVFSNGIIVSAKNEAVIHNALVFYGIFVSRDIKLMREFLEDEGYAWDNIDYFLNDFICVQQIGSDKVLCQSESYIEEVIGEMIYRINRKNPKMLKLIERMKDVGYDFQVYTPQYSSFNV